MQNDELKQKLQLLGFDDFGLFTLDNNVDFRDSLNNWLQNNYHGSMQWLEDRSEIRGYLLNMWQQAKTCLVVAANYAPDHNPLENLQYKNHGNISIYARNLDYHDVLKKKLKEFARWFVEKTDSNLKLFVDTAPVMEKPLAQFAQIGWQGKHTNIVSRQFGSWLFLGVLITDYEFDFIQDSNAHTNHCGQCTKCIDICPTNAFPKPYILDAKRCISYLTIEHKGHIPLEFRKVIGNRIYGCDDCLSICPWNKFAKTSQHIAFQAREELNLPTLQDLLQLDDIEFRKLFTKSPIKRIGRNRFIRNVLIAAGNSEDKTLIPYVQALLKDEDAIIQETASWALEQLRLF
jgi:epoxyqueuosine reductase